MIVKTLVLSTSHISLKTSEFLEASRWADNVEYGWLIPVIAGEELVMPEDIEAVLKFANDSDCVYVILDRDADCVGGLPQYGW